MPSELVIHVLSSETTVASYRDVIITHFRGPTLPDCTLGMRIAVRELGKQYKTLALLGVIEAESPPPGEEARAALTKFFEDHGDRLSGAVVTYRGTGFRAAVVRTIVTGVFNVMPRKRFPFDRHVVASLDEAASILRKYSTHPPGGLLSAFDELAATPAR